MDAYQQYIHKSRYARYLPEEKRRETWEETVNRYVTVRRSRNSVILPNVFQCRTIQTQACGRAQTGGGVEPRVSQHVQG